MHPWKLGEAGTDHPQTLPKEQPPEPRSWAAGLRISVSCPNPSPGILWCAAGNANPAWKGVEVGPVLAEAQDHHRPAPLCAMIPLFPGEEMGPGPPTHVALSLQTAPLIHSQGLPGPNQEPRLACWPLGVTADTPSHPLDWSVANWELTPSPPHASHFTGLLSSVAGATLRKVTGTENPSPGDTWSPGGFFKHF